ncbi:MULTISPECIES: HDOD domain-containing protein [Pseudomonas]|uniref:HDOD domain-containing protein n=1 Tax=Pseudomonas auratipiscis TaxID=3115853 RepID=A0AB35WZ25_9PSED|nr:MULTISPECIES: HDOD domain-containing protein [unclassified Pseudomonas]MEE1868659.1 HDOD domain-containing protein [Pseudomonas sp. 120P]MEE1958875.1 HDOD domain-containing protein [Pseudomonas sp. 119P]
MPIETNVPDQTPKTLAAWVKLLDSVRLPIPITSYERVNAAIADSRRSLRDIAELMQDSPALVLGVMREANHHTNTSIGEPAESLEIALNRLGLARTAELLERLPVLAECEIAPTLRQLQMVSQHASQQANGLFASRLARLWQEIHWGSLLFLSPLWPLALTFPKLLEDWELRVVHKGESAQQVEMELFGVRVLSLCKALAEHWRLPDWVTRGYQLLQEERRLLAQALHIARDQNSLRQQRRLDERPNLRRWFNQPANTVLLANGLALAAQVGWTNPHVRRWQLLTSLYLQTSLDEVQQLVHQQAATSARHHACHDLFHPAEALLWPWNQRRLHPGQIAPPPPSTQALGTWRKLCAELLSEPSPFSNAIHLTTVARDALVACGMQRVMLLMTDKTATQLRVHQTAGIPAEATSLVVSIEQSKLLQRLMSSSAQLRLTPENSVQFSALLPPHLRTCFRSEHVLLRSLSSNGRVVMVLIADQGGKPMADVSVQAFGKTAQCIERALTAFSNRSA